MIVTYYNISMIYRGSVLEQSAYQKVERKFRMVIHTILSPYYDISDTNILAGIEMEDLGVTVIAAWLDEAVLAAGKHRQVTRVVFHGRNPAVIPEHSGLADVHSMTVVAQSDSDVAEVQHLEEEEMADGAVAGLVGLVEGKEDHSANMAEVLRRPSRRPRQGCEGA
jgi:hypothetical protein